MWISIIKWSLGLFFVCLFQLAYKAEWEKPLDEAGVAGWVGLGGKTLRLPSSHSGNGAWKVAQKRCTQFPWEHQCPLHPPHAVICGQTPALLPLELEKGQRGKGRAPGQRREPHQIIHVKHFQELSDGWTDR